MTGKAVAKKADVEVAEEAINVEPTATVHEHPGGWHLVQYGNWQVSVGPDANIMLPRHLDPDEVDDFVGAVLAAAELGGQKKTVNEEAGRGDDRSLAPKIHIRQGGVPEGAMRMPFTKTPPTSATAPTPRGISQYGPQPAGTQGVQQRPRVPLPPTPRRRGQ